MRNILSYECYKRLPESLKFPLHEDGSQVFVADGRKPVHMALVDCR